MNSSKLRGILVWFLSGGFLLMAGSCEVGHLTPPEEHEEEEPPEEGEYASRDGGAGLSLQSALGTSGMRAGDITIHFL